jgi:hypothetical protein
MKNLIKLLGLIALAAVIVLSMAACPADAGDSGGGGGGGVPYMVSWSPPSGAAYGILEITFGVGSGGDNRQKVKDARKPEDIEMSPSDVLEFYSVVSSSTETKWWIYYTPKKGGTVKITLKPIAGCTFTKDRSGSDTITVTAPSP